ncbi:hypothetical protein ACQE3E_04130 [Methylomonas sp. MED-D]|uniref:DUF4912 domain-containing protein n=1 Tax=Methylomonas koyamae TaxID=702114 RepID=A0A177N7D6_9GAMM|nr:MULTISPECIES: hypothetical protein [Methylomonas]MDT4329903.1 hypothetical protein [Methylomonas sp. MV1]NJA07238.1 DUF4912 domain-containing protein [Methylococcaceae bacterium WWC4]OAI13781.1 hypothetical protein A1355_13105 [Methylomonas koyamae]
MAFSQSPTPSRAPLSAEELREISLSISRQFAPRRYESGVRRAPTGGFSPSELLEISQQISREYAPRARGSQASLLLLPIDPRHLHAFWQLDAPPPATLPNQPESSPLTLRIFRQAPATNPAADSPAPPASAPVWFDVPVAADASRQRIVLPEYLGGAAAHYRAVLGRLTGDRQFSPLAISNDAATAALPDGNHDLTPSVAQFMLPLQLAASSTLAADPAAPTSDADD